jgi:tetratricopeptide (TPR) repeat protein
MTRDLLCLAAVWAFASAMVAGAAAGATLEHGLAALKIGYETMALPKLEEALRIFSIYADGPDPDGTAHHHLSRAEEGLALYYADQDDKADAVRHLERGIQAAKVAIDRKGDVAAYHTTLGDLYGELAAQSGVVGKMRYGRLASASFAKALELDPKSPLAHVGAGIGKLETPGMFGGSVVEAIAEFRTAQSLDPACAEAWIWEGIAQRRLGALPEARRALGKALEVSPGNAHAQRELSAFEGDL